jgi:hypothetical protein
MRVVSVARHAGKRKRRRGVRLVLVVLPGGDEDGERGNRLLALVAAHRFGGEVLNGDAVAGRVGHGLSRPALPPVRCY